MGHRVVLHLDSDGDSIRVSNSDAVGGSVKEGIERRLGDGDSDGGRVVVLSIDRRTAAVLAVGVTAVVDVAIILVFAVRLRRR